MNLFVNQSVVFMSLHKLSRIRPRQNAQGQLEATGLPGSAGLGNSQEAMRHGAVRTRVMGGRTTALREREGTVTPELDGWRSALGASASSHLLVTLRKVSALAILKSRGKRKTGQKRRVWSRQRFPGLLGRRWKGW